MLKIKNVLIVLVLSFCLFCAYARAETQLKVRLVSDPQTLDWNLAHTHMETPIVMNIMEGLVEFDAKMNVKPALAKSWTVSADKKTYTFKLKPGVKWSDGKPLTAADFVYSWKRLLDPLTAAPYAYMLFDIAGAEEFNSRKVKDFSAVAIKAVDAQTVQVTLKKPVSYFLQMFTFWVTFPVRQDLVDKHGVSWSKPGNVAVVGPFVPVEYKPGSHLLMKRNELYHGKKPALDSVLMKIVNEDSTALNLFRAGQIDFVRPINFLEMGDLVKTPAFHEAPYYRTCFININTKQYPFTLPKVRQALAMAIDTTKIETIMHRSLKAAHSFVDPTIFPEGKMSGIGFNPEGAKKLLKDAGVDPTKMSHIELFTYASDENALLTQFIQDQLKKNLGLSVEIQMPEFKMYRTQLELGSGALYHRCWGADYADPDSYLGIFLSDSGNNRTGWKNTRYDELVKKAATLANGPERTKTYKEALDILLKQEAPAVPLYYDSLIFLVNPKFKNFVINPLNYAFFKDIVSTP